MYRYRPVGQRELDAVVDKKIWFSLLPELNDPFESNFKLDIDTIISADKDIQRKMSNVSYAEKLFYKKAALDSVDYDSFYRDILGHYTIACFSEINDSLLMWGHYSSGHKGVCIEYNTLELGEYGKVLIPVSYRKNFPLMSATSDINITYSFLLVMRTKSSDWSYEKEWRYLCI